MHRSAARLSDHVGHRRSSVKHPAAPRWLRSVLAVFSVLAVASPAAAQCTPVTVYDDGGPPQTTCRETLAAGRTVVDLGDGWTPRLLTETPEAPQAYRATFVALANERLGAGRDWRRARRDRYFELFGIFPSVSVIRGRLYDGERHECHAGIDDAPLRELAHTLEPWARASSAEQRAEARAVITVVQAHLRCERLLGAGARAGLLDAPTVDALALYQRRHMLPALPVIDRETRDTLLTPSLELDYRTLLRALRERVSDAAGLIEDGSALNAPERIFRRYIDAADYRRSMRAEPLARGAPDHVARATAAVALALGWTSPEATLHALARFSPTLVAVRLPPGPAYAAEPFWLRAEIDVGDARSAEPLGAVGGGRVSGRRPTLTLLAETSLGSVALVRWPTTVGGYKRERLPGGGEALRYKPSPLGRFVWRDLFAAPAWFPPLTTPDRELVQRSASGAWTVDTDVVGPGYASAYGLMALVHHRAPEGSHDTGLVDAAVRTHGSGSYRSVLRGSSHGCHRLFNHLALRLGSFLLSRGAAVRHGQARESYMRPVRWQGEVRPLRVGTRGYRYELTPPLEVDVLPAGGSSPNALGAEAVADALSSPEAAPNAALDAASMEDPTSAVTLEADDRC